MDRFEAAAKCAYLYTCFRSDEGKIIIVKRLWACYMYMEKALYKCFTLNTSLYFVENKLTEIVWLKMVKT